MKIELSSRKSSIPRGETGDPCFKSIEQIQGIFSQDEIVELVNRALYQLEYQHESHRRRAQAVRDREKEIKIMVKRMFNVPWSKATDEQIQAAILALRGKP